jgi:hypothetical protein
MYCHLLVKLVIKAVMVNEILHVDGLSSKATSCAVTQKYK